jgi:hypothetical protein
MAKKKINRKVVVHQHAMHVPVSKKNPTGTTIRHQHLRNVPSFSISDIEQLQKSLKKDKAAPRPTVNRLPFLDSDLYDELITVWMHFFNEKFTKPPVHLLDPDLFKALLASESGFDVNPPGNRKALGIAQITRPTLKALQDPYGEAKEFIFKGINQKDLLNPAIAIPLAVRWLFVKRELATHKLKRIPTVEEIILEYKGMLKSTSPLKEKTLKNFRDNYAKLKDK